jgi:dihydrofolate reductase
MKKIAIAGLQEKGNGIGFLNKLLHRIKPDIDRFIKISMGNVVLMGFNTWDSLGPKYQPLPGRKNVLLSTKTDLVLPEGVVLANTYEAAMSFCTAYALENNCDICIIGGQQIYQQALNNGDVDVLELTIFKGHPKEADTFFPDYSDYTKVIDITEGHHEKSGTDYTFLTLMKE